MAFTNAIILKAPALRVASEIIAVASNPVFSAALLLKPPTLRFGITYTGTSAGAYSAAKILSPTRLRPASRLLIPAPPPIFSNAVRLRHRSVTYVENPPAHFTPATKLGFGYGDGTGVIPITNFSIQGNQYLEILYPIVPVAVRAAEAHQMDDRRYRYIVKPSGDKIFTTLKLRIHSSYMPVFTKFIRDNRTTIVALTTPSLFIFGNPYVKSHVYIVDHTRPVLEKTQLWRIDVTFVQIAGIV